MRVLLFGLTGFGNAAFRALTRSGLHVCGIVTRKENGAFPYYSETSLAELGQTHDVPVLEGIDARSHADFPKLKALSPDLICVASFDQVLPYRVISLAKAGAINVHPSLLPRYRGATPTSWAIVFGEKETGITIHYLTKKLDLGDILAQRAIEIDPDDTDGTLRKRLADLAEAMLVDLLPKFTNGGIASVPLEENKLTYFPKRTRKDAWIRFDEPTANVYNRIRGMSPYPGPYTTHEGREHRILKAGPLAEASFEVAPGLVVREENGRLTVKTKDGAIQMELEPPIRRERIYESPVVLGEIKSPPPAPSQSYKSKINHTREVYGIESGAEEFPKMVVLSVAYPCNARCPNCPYTETNSDLRKKYTDMPYVPVEVFKKIARECGEYASFIRITGGGEPMLHPQDMAALIEYAKSVGARIWMTTNGSAFTDAKIERILACGADIIEFSVDAADPETYDIVRAGLDWNDLLHNVDFMLKKRRDMKATTRVVVSVINQDIIQGKIDQVAQFWLDRGVDEVIRRKYLTWGSNTSLDEGKSADPSPYLDKYAGVPCPFPFHRLNVDTRGKIEVCGYDIAGRTNFGDVRTQTIREIWQGPAFEWWRKMHAERRGGEIPLCRECPDWQYRSWNHNWEKVLATADKRRRQIIELDDTDEVAAAARAATGTP